jgi:hypothetical protein
MDANEPSAPRRRLRIPFAVAAPVILVCAAALQILRGEVIPVGGGLGWDGRFYAEAAANLPAALSDHAVDAYRARRIVPSALVWLVLQATGRPPDVAHARDVFAWLNLAFGLATLAAWTAAARRSGVGERGLWLGFVLLFFNFANLKMPYYYAPLTDSCAQALGAALLYCHVARRRAAMMLVLAIGAFTWPSLLAFGAFLFVYPPGPVSSTPAPAWWRATVTGGTVAAFAALTWVHREAVAEHGGGILAAIVVMAYLARVVGDLTATEGVAPRALLGGGAWRRWAMVAALGAAVSVAMRAFAAPALFDTAYFLRHLAIYSQARSGVFLVAHAAYFGLVVAVLIAFWPRAVAAAHRLGTGMTLFLLVHLVWGIHSESRQIVDALPAFALVATLAASTVPWPGGTVAVAAMLGFLTSKAWFPINRGGFIGRSDPASYPAQYYFMNQGPWMAAGPFLLQAVVLLAVCGLLWMARHRRTEPLPPDVAPAPPEASREDIPALTFLRMIAVGLRIPLAWNRPERWPLLLSSGMGAALLLLAITMGAALQLVRRGPPVTAAEATRATAGRPDQILTVSLRSAERRGDDLRRVPLPESWQGTPLVELIASVDGRPVPFTVGEPGPGHGASVFTRSLRAGSVLIRCPTEAACANAVLVRPDGRLRARIGVQRLAAAPAILMGIGALGALWMALLLAASRRRPVLHPWLHVAVAATIAALAAGFGLDSWRGGLALVLAGTLWAAAPFAWARNGRPAGLR